MYIDVLLFKDLFMHIVISRILNWYVECYLSVISVHRLRPIVDIFGNTSYTLQTFLPFDLSIETRYGFKFLFQLQSHQCFLR